MHSARLSRVCTWMVRPRMKRCAMPRKRRAFMWTLWRRKESLCRLGQTARSTARSKSQRFLRGLLCVMLNCDGLPTARLESAKIHHCGRVDRGSQARWLPARSSECRCHDRLPQGGESEPTHRHSLPSAQDLRPEITESLACGHCLRTMDGAKATCVVSN